MKPFSELLLPRVFEVVQALQAGGGHAYLVGGSVRDWLLQKQLSDYDIEVHNLSIEKIQSILSQYGVVELVGSSFGVLKIHGLPVDWSIPRTDSVGRKPIVQLTPSLSIEQALQRRDLTINAMAIDLSSGDLIDPFGGQKDLEAHVLRAPDPVLFVQDPLRFYRVMQFIGRFSDTHTLWWPDETLNTVCKTMQLTDLSRERVEQELAKLLIKGVRPSYGFRWVATLGRLTELFPELGTLHHVPQNPAWHPEGDVLEHTLQALDSMAWYFKTHTDHTYDERLTLMYAILCHDFGKAITTEWIDERWRSIGHDRAGVPLAHAFLKRFTRNQHLLTMVPILVQHHMVPGIYIKNNALPATYKLLAAEIAPHATLWHLAIVAYADHRGRNSIGGAPLETSDSEVDQFVEKAQALGVLYGPEPALLTGSDLLPFVEPGPEIGTLLRKAYELQITRGIRDRATLIKKIIK